MHSLPIFMRLEGRPVILVGDGPMVMAKRRLLEAAGARVVGEGDAAALAIVGPDEPAATAERLRKAGVLVNAVDRPALCDWTLPAIVERGPVVVAIGTGGVSAGLAAALRQRLELLLPSALGRVAEALHAARAALRARFPDERERRRAIAAMLAPGAALDPLVDQPTPDTALASVLDAGGQGRAAGIEHIRVRSTDPDELSLRAARLLAQADRLYLGPDIPSTVAARARADAERLSAPPPAQLPPGLSVVLEWCR